MWRAMLERGDSKGIYLIDPSGPYRWRLRESDRRPFARADP
jgi:hypothetical protein